MDWYPLILGIFGIVIIIETFLLVGVVGLVRDEMKTRNLILANYKADLEMVLLHAHDFDEFMRTNEEVVRQNKLDPEDTYYIH